MKNFEGKDVVRPEIEADLIAKIKHIFPETALKSNKDTVEFAITELLKIYTRREGI